MKKRGMLMFVLCLLTLTGCYGNSTTVPQNAEEVDTFEEVLTFMSKQTDVNVTEIQVQEESEAVLTEPIVLSEEDAGTLLSLMEIPPIGLERYEPIPVYGGRWYSVICTLENGETLTFYPKADALTFTRAELNEEGKWYYPSYRLLYEDSAVPEEIYAFVVQHWMLNNN